MDIKYKMGMARGKNRTPLTEKQERFCLEYVTNAGNAAEAARLAGYSAESSNSLYVEGSRLLRNAKIVQRIEQLREEIGLCLVSREYVLQGLLEIVERSMQRVAVLDDEGNETGEYRFDAKEARSALELLGKANGLFVNRIEMERKEVKEFGYEIVEKQQDVLDEVELLLEA